jgi:hypothetical protein
MPRVKLSFDIGSNNSSVPFSPHHLYSRDFLPICSLPAGRNHPIIKDRKYDREGTIVSVYRLRSAQKLSVNGILIEVVRDRLVKSFHRSDKSKAAWA